MISIMISSLQLLFAYTVIKYRLRIINYRLLNILNIDCDDFEI